MEQVPCHLGEGGISFLVSKKKAGPCSEALMGWGRRLGSHACKHLSNSQDTEEGWEPARGDEGLLATVVSDSEWRAWVFQKMAMLLVCRQQGPGLWISWMAAGRLWTWLSGNSVGAGPQARPLPPTQAEGALGSAGRCQLGKASRSSETSPIAHAKSPQVKSRNASILGPIGTRNAPFPMFSGSRPRGSQRLSSLVGRVKPPQAT